MARKTVATVEVRMQADGQYHWSLSSNRRVMATGYGYSSSASNARRAFRRVRQILASGRFRLVSP